MRRWITLVMFATAFMVRASVASADLITIDADIYAPGTNVVGVAAEGFVSISLS
jgi:hypothetical protein